MLNIKINEALLYTLVTYDIKVEEFMIIACLNLDMLVPLRVYLRNKTSDQMLAYMQPMVRKLLLKQLVQLDEFSWDNYELTDLADQVFEECAIHIVMDESTLVKEPLVPADKVTKLVEDYIALFPEGVRNAGQEYLRANAKDVATKMSGFLKKYRFPAEVILGATARYVKQQAREQYKWCSAAHFFISKNGASKLATECDAYNSNKDEVQSDDWRNTLM